mmetsp:Transcript_8521/g.20455  ORF Transcript_8521/g.20455 Transcript_8521/m.20455 type:complete len:102 (-) Transcript_8521:40-345(-)|eukprot:CAMPEP_0177580072 /NCGR_PEP_ID=MMETSP0419_2-20121207/1345_1 /TAXON_ID=582737 /ORGANISM="Tetraselmis sp., Strain GSL018" /LENGTH=101 /DNA_ID=CAMNT_0019068875 /DNA_START=475 /DNA_END=780 /DNA_ORIENTATION=+
MCLLLQSQVEETAMKKHGSLSAIEEERYSKISQQVLKRRKVSAKKEEQARSVEEKTKAVRERLDRESDNAGSSCELKLETQNGDKVRRTYADGTTIEYEEI